MCLDTLDNKIRKVKRGYKVFCENSNGTFSGDHFSYTAQRKIGEWYKSTNVMIDMWSFKYKSGFHCFTTIEAARHWINITNGWASINGVVCEVEIDPDSIVASGTQNDYNCVVAQRIRIKRKIKTK